MLQDSFSICNIVHYVSFRSIAALLTSLCMSLAFGKSFIAFSQQAFRNSARPFTPENHQLKGSTPTMGGCFILAVAISNLLLWCDWYKLEIWLFVLVLVGFGAIGFLDDLYKIWYKNGLYPRQKFSLQVVMATCVVLAWIYTKSPSYEICVPFFKNIHIDFGYFIIPWLVFIIVAMSNAVNLTDGLDGLAVGILLSNFSVFSIVSYLAGHYAFASYLHIPFTGTAEVAIVGSVLIGACLGFLWFNAHPAQIFMGDVGSLSLGAGLALMAIVSKQELLLPIAGGLFVFEVLSVIGQYISIKYYGKKLFKMAPVHHHFELLGWQEPKITVRFNIISIVLCLFALITLKVR
ncbi:MAG: phospho-N-acetylmuramoyl-pentapeptide-transferase [Epsilonproteobacteria bacterium]|nr:phospho-N-acetylmuramoyl-pentapeptide-transferase [Campylobacterota bacterium]